MRRSSFKVAVQANSKLALIMDTPSVTQPAAQVTPSSEDRATKRLSDQSSNIVRWSSSTAAGLIKSSSSRSRTTTGSEVDEENKLKLAAAIAASSERRFDTIRPHTNTPDERACVFCQQVGDQDPNAASRLLAMDVDRWSHLNCALWSDGVYETMNGSLVNVDTALKKSTSATSNVPACAYCHTRGASIRCFAVKCNVTYHFPCALKDKCLFTTEKTVLCPAHAAKVPLAADLRLTDLSVARNVWIQRDEVAQIQR